MKALATGLVALLAGTAQHAPAGESASSGFAELLKVSMVLPMQIIAERCDHALPRSKPEFEAEIRRVTALISSVVRDNLTSQEMPEKVSDDSLSEMRDVLEKIVAQAIDMAEKENFLPRYCEASLRKMKETTMESLMEILQQARGDYAARSADGQAAK